MSKQQAVIKQEERGLAQSAGPSRGFEYMDTADVSIPQIKVLQATSPEVKERIGAMGDIIHTAANTVTEGIFIPLVIWNTRCFFVPRDQSKKLQLLQELGVEDDSGFLSILCMSKDGQVPSFSMIGKEKCHGCKFAQWVGNTPPKCSQSINVLAYLVDLQLPGVIRFSGASYRYGKKFRDSALWLGADLFANKYKLDVQLARNNKGEFYVTPVKLVGKVNDEEYATAEALYNRFFSVVQRIETDDDAPF